MAMIYTGLQNKPGIVDVPPFVGNATDGAAVDVELRFDAVACPDRMTVLMELEKIKLFLSGCAWPPANQAL